MFRRPSYLVGLSLCALLCVGGIAAAQPAPPAQANPLPQLGQMFVDELKKPEYGISTCMLTPVFASDGMTVAVSTDRVFSAGDVVIAVGGEPVDTTAERPVGSLLNKHEPKDSVQIKIRRADRELIVTTPCADTKPFFDLLLEAAFAASKNDAASCADKMNAARGLHALNFKMQQGAYICAARAGRIVGSPDLARGYYEIHRELILENKWSLDALSRIRGTILSVVDMFQKQNNSLFGDDLKQQYEQAVAAKSPPAPSSPNGSR
jgi:hypothetical protein